MEINLKNFWLSKLKALNETSGSVGLAGADNPNTREYQPVIPKTISGNLDFTTNDINVKVALIISNISKEFQNSIKNGKLILNKIYCFKQLGTYNKIDIILKKWNLRTSTKID